MELKRGYVRENGDVFIGYRTYKGKKKEQWLDPLKYSNFLLKARKRNVEYRKRKKEANPKKIRTIQDIQESKSTREAYKINWRLENKEKIAQYNKKWSEKNSDRVKQYRKDRYQNPLIKVITRARTRTRFAFKNNSFSKDSITQKIIGCDWFTLKNHIENQFVDGMSWDNFNKIHIDHKIPLSSAKSKEEVFSLCHYTNLQPLWAVDNLIKSNKI